MDTLYTCATPGTPASDYIKLAGTHVNHTGVLAVDSYSDSSLAAGILIFILSFLISYVKSVDFTVDIST